MDIGTISLLIVVAMIALMLTGMPLAWVTMLLAVGCTLFWLGPAGLPLRRLMMMLTIRKTRTPTPRTGATCSTATATPRRWPR